MEGAAKRDVLESGDYKHSGAKTPENEICTVSAKRPLPLASFVTPHPFVGALWQIQAEVE